MSFLVMAGGKLVTTMESTKALKQRLKHVQMRQVVFLMPGVLRLLLPTIALDQNIV